MIVLVETNFLIELALRRSDHKSVLAILEMAEQQKIQLAIPAFSIAESYHVVIGRGKERKPLVVELERQTKELARSEPYAQLLTEFGGLLHILTTSGVDERTWLNEVVERILKCAHIIPMESATLHNALIFQSNRGLAPQDSIVYASIVGFLEQDKTEPRCFITQDGHYFDPDVRSDLNALNCRLMSKFVDGVGYIQSVL